MMTYCYLQFIFGMMGVTASLFWMMLCWRVRGGEDNRSWVCIDLPSPDTPASLTRRLVAWLRQAPRHTPDFVLALPALAISMLILFSPLLCCTIRR